VLSLACTKILPLEHPEVEAVARAPRRQPFPILFFATLATAVIASAVGAEEPVLRVQTGSAFFSYPLVQISRVAFTGDTLVVETGIGADSFPLGTVRMIDFSSIATAVENPAVATALPRILSLFPNRPNPFSPWTKISFHLSEPGRAEVKIFGVNGRLIRSLVDGEAEAGLHELFWDGCDDAGRRVGAGVYLCKLSAPGVEESRRMTLLP
jgi:hypothetical protein